MNTATSLTTWPAPSISVPALYNRSAALGAATVIVLQLSTIPFLKVGLVRMKIKRVAGTGATFTPLIFSKVAVTTAGDIAQEYAGAATAVATLFDPQLGDAPVWMQTDATGALYLVIGPNAGADNTFDYLLRFLVAA